MSPKSNDRILHKRQGGREGHGKMEAEAGEALGRRGDGEPGTLGKPTDVGRGVGGQQQEPERPLVPCPSAWNIPEQNLKPNSYAYL